MSRTAGERLRLLVIGSTVTSAALIVLLGVPRARTYMTPHLERVWLVAAALGDRVATGQSRQVAVGTPVTLYALIEARPRWGAENVLYGRVEEAVLPGQSHPRPVQQWSNWWLLPEFLWFKVEPAFPFANDGFDPEFKADGIGFVDNYQVTWGFDWSHAADITPGGDAYPDWPTGTMRFAARAVVRDSRDRILQRAGSPGAEAVHATGVGEQPYRLTVTGGDDAFGVLGGFAGLPYVPTVGKVDLDAHVASRYLGGTVLDFWLLSLRATGAWHDGLISWQQLPQVAELVVADMFLARDGIYYYTEDPLRPVRWGQVQSGDIVTIDDHVGILYEDRGPGGGGDGLLNRQDRVIEAYFEPLRNSEMGAAFVSDVAVYRLPARSQRP